MASIPSVLLTCNPQASAPDQCSFAPGLETLCEGIQQAQMRAVARVGGTVIMHGPFRHVVPLDNVPIGERMALEISKLRVRLQLTWGFGVAKFADYLVEFNCGGA